MMKMRHSSGLVSAVLAALLLCVFPASAQHGKQLPPPPSPFVGVIKEDATDSKPFWPPTAVPTRGAPNVLLIMTDDQGYGVSGTFGGIIPTPAMDRIAKAGLRHTQFHSTALCSPTRAALSPVTLLQPKIRRSCSSTDPWTRSLVTV
jgi:hypothetical protein